MFGITPVASSNTIIYRDGNGHANITTPTQSNHIANKRYVDNAISGKQDTLVSGTNIKTINGESILGSGNITIQGGGAFDVVDLPWITGVPTNISRNGIYKITGDIYYGINIEKKDLECVIIPDHYLVSSGISLWWANQEYQPTDTTFHIISPLPFTLNVEESQEGETVYSTYLQVTEVKPIYVQQKYDATANILTAMVFQL